MSGQGKLILLPNLLDEAASAEEWLPARTGRVVQLLQGLITESEKGARRYVRRFISHDEMAALPLRLLNEHTQEKEAKELLHPLVRGECWGLLSDAGLPCIADPGANLVGWARGLGIAVEAFSGPSSLLLALQLSGFGGQRFAFHGYLPKDPVDLERRILELEQRAKSEQSTQLFIEAPYRSAKLLAQLISLLQPATGLAVAASLTGPNQRVVVQTVAEWRKREFVLSKEPVVFLING